MRITVLKAATTKKSGFKQWWMNNFLFSWPLFLWCSRCDILLEISGKVILVDFSKFLSKNSQNCLQFSSVMLWGYFSIISTRYCRMPSHPRGSVIEPTEKLSEFSSKDRTSFKQNGLREQSEKWKWLQMLRKTNVTCHSHEFLLKDGHLHFLEVWNDTVIGMGPCNNYILWMCGCGICNLQDENVQETHLGGFDC